VASIFIRLQAYGYVFVEALNVFTQELSCEFRYVCIGFKRKNGHARKTSQF